MRESKGIGQHVTHQEATGHETTEYMWLLGLWRLDCLLKAWLLCIQHPASERPVLPQSFPIHHIFCFPMSHHPRLFLLKANASRMGDVFLSPARIPSPPHIHFILKRFSKPFLIFLGTPIRFDCTHFQTVRFSVTCHDRVM